MGSRNGGEARQPQSNARDGQVRPVPGARCPEKGDKRQEPEARGARAKETTIERARALVTTAAEPKGAEPRMKEHRDWQGPGKTLDVRACGAQQARASRAPWAAGYSLTRRPTRLRDCDCLSVCPGHWLRSGWTCSLLVFGEGASGDTCHAPRRSERTAAPGAEAREPEAGGGDPGARLGGLPLQIGRIERGPRALESAFHDHDQLPLIPPPPIATSDPDRRPHCNWQASAPPSPPSPPPQLAHARAQPSHFNQCRP
ncbi:hypothetical protein C8Q78DRAFT_306156 [Trametes maxima]|nr:hypothetical protein C8Q78DRAFT_306156 [Trametes maxima]